MVNVNFKNIGGGYKPLGFVALRNFAKAALAIAALIALAVDPALADSAGSGQGIMAFIRLFCGELENVEPAHVLAGVFAVWLFKKEFFSEEHPFMLSAAVVSAIFSFFLLVGMSLAATGDLAFIVGSGEQAFIALIVFVGFWGIFYGLVKIFYEKLDVLKLKTNRNGEVPEFISKHFLIVSIVSLLICWTVLALPYFPGSVPHDGRYELNQFFGLSSYSTQHPIMSTLIMGGIYKAGYVIGGSTLGCVFYVAFQSVLGAVVFGNICNYIFKKTESDALGLVTLLFYAISPVWWAGMQAVIKDTLYFIVYAWFVLE